ncbi:MAG: EF-P beta-lysylation protein EpmB, partial [Pseudomonadota bacterium]
MTSELLPIAARENWQSQLRNVIKSSDELFRRLDLKRQDLDFRSDEIAGFELRVPEAFVNRMQRGDATDPLLLQVMLQQHEAQDVSGYSMDPVGETGEANPTTGLIHKYHGRVLLVVTSGCAIHCRYCFRRHFPYNENRNSRHQWRDALRYIAKDKEITEVILSGGDPLMASDSFLHDLVSQIDAIPHVKRLRIHSRLPIVIPDRVTGSLIEALTRPNLQTIMVVHSNHANEIDSTVDDAMKRLARAGITLLNQSVLLANINDQAKALIALSERLFYTGVLPYYLHLLDKVQGAAHFAVAEARALSLHREITQALPGYLVPKLVREIAGEKSKTL